MSIEHLLMNIECHTSPLSEALEDALCALDVLALMPHCYFNRFGISLQALSLT